MNLLLAVSVEQWILLGVLLLVLIISPIFMMAKNKKAMATTQKMIDDLKKGDTILTTAGVIGKVVSIDNKEGYKTVTIETGDEKHKGYMCIDVASIYYNLSNPTVPEQNATKNNNTGTQETKTETNQENKEVTANLVEEIKETTVQENETDKTIVKNKKKFKIKKI